MLTARGQTVDKVVGLKLGADDYVTSPSSWRSSSPALRPGCGAHRAATDAGVHVFGDVRVDVRAAEVTRGGLPAELSAREFQLLKYFLEHRGAVSAQYAARRGLGLSRHAVDTHGRRPRGAPAE